MNIDVDPREIARHELIGLDCVVVESTDPTYVGVEGRVVYETSSTLHIDTGSEDVSVIPKPETRFEFHVDGEVVGVDGSVLEERPADRVKNKV